jgi:hypothetical protein
VFKKIKYAIYNFFHPIKAARGEVFVQQSGPRTGKSVRARKWQSKDPSSRMVVDGNWMEAQRLADVGFAVVLNLLPGMPRAPWTRK